VAGGWNGARVAHAEITRPFVMNENHPLLVDGQLFGGTRNTRWLSRAGFPKTHKGKPVTPQVGQVVAIETPLLQGTETFRLYDQNGLAGYGQASKLRYTLGADGSESYEATLKPRDKSGSVASWRVAINGEWNGAPRPLKEMKPQTLFAVDIDGDGKDEHIRVRSKASKDANTGKAPGKGTGKAPGKGTGKAPGKVLTSQATNDTAGAAEVVTLTLEMNGKTAPLTSIEVDNVYTTGWQLIALDFDGDGKLEILLTTLGKESSVELYEIKSTKPVLVLAAPPQD